MKDIDYKHDGGYNGGGSNSPTSKYGRGASGGGATHIALKINNDNYTTLSSYGEESIARNYVLAVAGGGGGCDNIGPGLSCSPTTGGDGGGGNKDGTNGDLFIDSAYDNSGFYDNGGGEGGKVTGGSTFGKGESFTLDTDGGGAGGGFYGGKVYTGQHNNNSSGGGGSGFVNTSITHFK